MQIKIYLEISILDIFVKVYIINLILLGNFRPVVDGNIPGGIYIRTFFVNLYLINFKLYGNMLFDAEP